jgi:hypothetical protein
MTKIWGSCFKLCRPICQATNNVHFRPAADFGKLYGAREGSGYYILLIVGDRDRDTTIAGSYAMFHAATGTKELWVVHGARHVDLYGYVGNGHEIRVLDFFDT